jgi:pimeloyl-ACP methyl ester carboxylesterase
VKNVLALSKSHEVWALDIPGFGDSALPPEVRDADDLVPYLRDLLQHAFAHQRVDVVAFSFGGLTAGLLAAQDDHNMQRLVLVGVPGLGLMHEVLPMRGMLPGMTEAQQRQVHRHNLNMMMLHHASSITEEVIDLQVANVNRDRMRRRRIARTDVLAKAQDQWKIPVHGIWGENDALYRGNMDNIGAALPKLSSLTRVADAGHWVMFERPVAFHAALENALANPLPV